MVAVNFGAILSAFGLFAIIFFISYAFLHKKVQNAFKYSVYLGIYGFLSVFLIVTLGEPGLIVVLISIILGLVVAIRQLMKEKAQ